VTESKIVTALLRGWAGLVLLYLFLPIFVVVAFSFNNPEGKFNFVWKSFSLEAWTDPFRYPALVDAFETSIQVALLSTGIALVLGTALAIALVRYRWKASRLVNFFLVLPLTTPEVVLGSSLLTLFLDIDRPLGFGTIVIAHVAFQVSFVTLTVKARIRGFDWTLEDAAMDLGASPTRTFLRVTLPLILPGIVAAAMLSFALSMDDFIITYFVSGSEVTYPIFVYGAQRTELPPQINVLATTILLISLLGLAASYLLQRLRTRSASLTP
jgi:spermidine/putrescine transport system permease protein